MPQPTLYNGGCHCGRVRFSAQLSTFSALSCNCSICSASGFLHLILEKEQFELLSGDDALTSYRYNTGIADHLFCKHCGIKSFYKPRSHPNGISVNIRCFDTLEITDFEIAYFEGKHWEENVESIR